MELLAKLELILMSRRLRIKDLELENRILRSKLANAEGKVLLFQDAEEQNKNNS